jgi:hypothetical protein
MRHITIMSSHKHRFSGLKWVGPAFCRDFDLLGIETLDDLAKADPDDLYARIQKITGEKHDPCVWDVFACAIDQAKGQPAKPWWAYTKIRKLNMKMF